MKNKPTKKRIEHTVQKRVDKTLASVFKDIYKLDSVPSNTITPFNLTRLKHLKKELAGLKREFNYLLVEILEDYKKSNYPPAPKKIIYTDNEDSFRRFQSLKTQITVDEFLIRNRIELDPESDYYDAVEAILWYNDWAYIYVIKEGKKWQYDAYKFVIGKYVYFINDESIYQGIILEDVESVMFRDYLRMN